MIGLFRVPIERVGQGATVDLEGHNVCTIRSCLRMDVEAVGDRRIRRDYRMLCTNSPARCSDRHDATVLADALDRAVSEKVRAVVMADFRQAREILQGVEG